jgi:prefoldin subunit 5
MSHITSEAVAQLLPSIEVREVGVLVHDLFLPGREVGEYLRTFPEEERIPALEQALKVGIYCLERARSVQDTEFVRRQVEAVLRQLEQASQAIPGAVEKGLLEKIGMDDGQALAPVRALVDEAKRAVTDRLQEVRTLLVEEIDPTKTTSKLGAALGRLNELLDPVRRDSVQGAIGDAVTKVVGEDGALARTVKLVVQDAMKPLADEVNRLAKQIQADQAVMETIEQSTAKGYAYEDEVVQVLVSWAKHVGIEVHHVGSDNQPGDIILVDRGLSQAGSELTIVVEAKDRASAAGRRRISEDMSTAMASRTARAGLYVSKTGAGLAAEIGDWAEGVCEAGNWLAVTHEHLMTAVRFLLAKQRLIAESASRSTTDLEAVEGQLQRIRTAMDRVTEINRKVTNAKAALEGIRSEGEGMRTDVRDALIKIEDALRVEPVMKALDPTVNR